ncbi:MAG: hypothetical protein AAF628_37010 [Planctomycetota bacterium]
MSPSIPRHPALLGRALHAQALLLQWPGTGHLGNVVSDSIWP